MGVQFAAIDTSKMRTVTLESGETFEVPSRVDLDEKYEYFGWANSNARIMFILLGINNDEDLHGEASIPDARRAIMLARNTFEKKAPSLERPEEVIYGKPTEDEGGVVELRPERVRSFGLDSEGIMRRLNDFEEFVNAADNAGADAITWG